MHWHAMKPSAHSHENAIDDAEEAHLTNILDNHRTNDEALEHVFTTDVPLGNDDAADVKTGYGVPDIVPSMRETHIHESRLNHSEASSEAGDDSLRISIPTFTSGTTPYGYQQALRNRIKEGKLQPNAEYDMHAFTPTFIHDCLMLPGSLTQLLGKLDTLETIRRMAPALLPGFHAYVHTHTLQPCILPSLSTTDYVQGMIIFGQGKESRDHIHQHYRENCRRVKVQVEIDVSVPVSPTDRDHPLERWRLQRRKIWAHAWLWANVGRGDVKFRRQGERWTIEDYLSGALESCTEAIDIQEVWPDAEIDVDGDSEMEPKPKQPEREVIYGGYGHLDYIVDKHFTGW